MLTETQLEEVTAEVLEQIQGSANDLTFIMENIEEERGITFNVVEEKAINEAVENTYFVCAECGWWNEVGYWNTSNDNAEDICLDCEPAEEEE